MARFALADTHLEQAQIALKMRPRLLEQGVVAARLEELDRALAAHVTVMAAMPELQLDLSKDPSRALFIMAAYFSKDSDFKVKGAAEFDAWALEDTSHPLVLMIAELCPSLTERPFTWAGVHPSEFEQHLLDHLNQSQPKDRSVKSLEDGIGSFPIDSNEYSATTALAVLADHPNGLSLTMDLLEVNPSLGMNLLKVLHNRPALECLIELMEQPRFADLAYECWLDITEKELETKPRLAAVDRPQDSDDVMPNTDQAKQWLQSAKLEAANAAKLIHWLLNSVSNHEWPLWLKLAKELNKPAYFSAMHWYPARKAFLLSEDACLMS